MPQPIISFFLKGLVSDTSGILIPFAFDRLEVLAASSIIAKGLAIGREPDRQDFIASVSTYLRSLPKDETEAKVIISRDAATILGIPGISQDRDAISAAREAMAQAEAALADATGREYQRMSRINSLESQLVETARELEKWEVDYDSEITAAEETIIQHHGSTNCVGKIDAIPYFETLKRLAPKAIAGINKRLSELQDELQDLRGGTKKAPRKSQPAELTF